MIKSSTMMYILRRHVGENDPSQPVCHDEEQCTERENSTKPPVKPEEKKLVKPTIFLSVHHHLLKISQN